jgi:hypothetical protein
MNIAVIGSRTVTNYEYVKSVLNEYIHTNDDVIVSGGANGADGLGERYAHEFCVNEPIIHEAKWGKFGKSAGFKRNHLIIEDSEMVIAFWDFESKGTKHSIDLAKASKKLVYVFGVDFDVDTYDLDEL